MIQTAGVGLSLSQDNAFCGSADQCEIREVDVCVCVFTDWAKTQSVTQSPYSGLAASFFFGVRIMLRMTFNYLILWVRVKGQG